EVFLITSNHFRVLGDGKGVLELQRDGSGSPDVFFDLEVVAPDAPGDGVVTAFFLRGGRPCGSVTRSVGELRSGARAGTLATASVRADLAALPADLCIRVAATPEKNDGRSFLCWYATQLPHETTWREPEPWNLPHVSSQVVAGYMSQFVSDSTSTMQRRDAL